MLRCFTDVDISSTSIKLTVRNFEYQTDPKTSVGTGMIRMNHQPGIGISINVQSGTGNGMVVPLVYYQPTYEI